MQVGPIGPAPAFASSTYQWGTFISVTGSQDVIVPYFNPTGYVWGMSGSMVQMVYFNTTRAQTYQGTFYVGYVSSLSQSLKTRAVDVSILDGTFNLTWFLTTDSNGVVSSTLSGKLMFDDIASLPLGWAHPITLGRFGELSAATSTEGILLLEGTKNYCFTSSPCVFNQVPPSQVTGGGSTLSKHVENILIGVLVSFGVVIILLAALLLWYRNKRHFEEEDGIFAAARKPEYGNALVVDDIIQETREHGGGNTLIPRLDRHPGDTGSDLSEDELDRRPRSRSTRRTPSSRPPHSPGSSPARSRNVSRSRSRSHSRPRSRAQTRRSERSRSPPPRESDSESYYSDAGSSASRATTDEE